MRKLGIILATLVFLTLIAGTFFASILVMGRGQWRHGLLYFALACLLVICLGRRLVLGLVADHEE